MLNSTVGMKPDLVELLEEEGLNPPAPTIASTPTAEAPVTQAAVDKLLEDLPEMPDLAAVIDSIDFDKQPIAHSIRPPNERFSVGKWGALAMELIAYPSEQEQILEDFGLTNTQFAELMGNPVFQAVYKETEKSIIELAANGGYQLAHRRLSEQGIAVLEEIMTTGDDKERLKAVELSARLGSLDPLVQAKTQPQQSTGGAGVQLVVNFSQGLRVPEAFKGGSVVIDAETTNE